MKAELVHILRHSLGLDNKGRGREYRNHFATGSDTDDYPLCVQLTELGMMTDHGPVEMWGGMHGFTVTELGKQEAKKKNA